MHGFTLVQAADDAGEGDGELFVRWVEGIPLLAVVLGKGRGIGVG